MYYQKNSLGWVASIPAVASVASSVFGSFGQTKGFQQRQQVRDAHYSILKELRALFSQTDDKDLRGVLQPILAYHSDVVKRGASPADLEKIKNDVLGLQKWQSEQARGPAKAGLFPDITGGWLLPAIGALGLYLIIRTKPKRW